MFLEFPEDPDKSAAPELEISRSQEAKDYEENQESIRRDLEVPKELTNLFRLGGWCRRLQRVDPASIKEPNEGSRRPPDIPVIVWSGCGKGAQDRELQCRELEDQGHGPPPISQEVASKLPDKCKQQMLLASARQEELTIKYLERLEAQDETLAADGTAAVAAKEGLAEEKCDAEVAPTAALAARLAAWPEGNMTRESLVQWCIDEGVPPPCPDRSGHRQRSGGEQLGFGMVTRPIPANSKERKFQKGQDAISKEMGEHNKRGTWNLSSVMELDDLLKECRESGEEVVIGGVHPILGAKHAETAATSEDEDYR